MQKNTFGVKHETGWHTIYHRMLLLHCSALMQLLQCLSERERERDQETRSGVVCRSARRRESGRRAEALAKEEIIDMNSRGTAFTDGTRAKGVNIQTFLQNNRKY